MESPARLTGQNYLLKFSWNKTLLNLSLEYWKVKIKKSSVKINKESPARPTGQNYFLQFS
jgi:hypothetical protein